MEKLNFNAPINSVSFGNCSYNILVKLFEKEKQVNLFPIGNGVDLSSFKETLTKDFADWLSASINQAGRNASKKNPGFKLWHINGALESISNNQTLFTFHELDSITEHEKNILNNQAKTIVSSSYTKTVFEEKGVRNVAVVPLGFNNKEFFKIDNAKKTSQTAFAMLGKWEKRKHHAKILAAWVKKYGNNPDYVLNCSIENPFLNQDELLAEISKALNGKRYFNVNFVKHLPSNFDYNRFLNVNDIVIGMSGGEGWALPEFQSVCLGKHAVILNAHAYKEWANKENACMVEPSGLVDVYDNRFFKKGNPYNQGRIFDWKEEDFLSACEEAEKRFQQDPLNRHGESLSDKFTWSKTTDLILNQIFE